MSTALSAPESPALRESGKLNTIVCGTDFSVQAQEAANASAALARRTGATLVLVHAHESMAVPHDPTAFRDGSAGARQQLAMEARRLRADGIDVKEKFFMSTPLQGLMDALRSEGADLLVVSSLGRVAPSHFVMPNVAERAAENSAVPTLVVRGDGAFRNWATGKAPLKVFLAYDFSSTAGDALEWLRKLRGIGPCEVTVAYAAYPPQESWRLGVGEHMYTDALLPEMHRLIKCDLKERVHEAVGAADVKIRIEPTWGRPDPVLLSLAKESNADLIVVGTHQRRGFSRFWLGSVSRGILRDAACSVAMVPRSQTTAENTEDIPSVRRVLVTTDFSELGNGGIRHAYSLLPNGGAVCLVHVHVPGGVNVSAHARLRALVPTGAGERDIATVIDVIESHHAAAAICQAAERFGADVICMASHGRSGVSKTFMGSVAQDVMSRSTRPVLTIRAPET